jgi:hypothetical protein
MTYTVREDAIGHAKAWVSCRSLARIEGSNRAVGMNLCVVCVV